MCKSVHQIAVNPECHSASTRWSYIVVPLSFVMFSNNCCNSKFSCVARGDGPTSSSPHAFTFSFGLVFLNIHHRVSLLIVRFFEAVPIVMICAAWYLPYTKGHKTVCDFRGLGSPRPSRCRARPIRPRSRSSSGPVGPCRAGLSYVSVSLQGAYTSHGPQTGAAIAGLTAFLRKDKEESLESSRKVPVLQTHDSMPRARCSLAPLCASWSSRQVGLRCTDQGAPGRKRL